MDIERPDSDRLRHLYVDERRTVAEVADVLGVARGTAHNWLRAANIELRPSPSKRRNDISDDQVRELYVTKQLSAPDIARRLGRGTSTVYHDQLGIPRRHDGHGTARPDRSELHQLYIDEGLSLRQIAARYDVTPPAVAGWLRHSDIPVRPARTPRVAVDRDAVVHAYRSGLSGLELAAQHGCSTATIYRELEAAGVPRRRHQRELSRNDLITALETGCTAEEIAHAP
jgi:transposase